MPIEITPIYAALITVLFILLSARVVMQRNSARVSLGDGGDKQLFSRIRAHGNCAEYAPLGILLLLIAELSGTAPWGLHLVGILLLVGRVSHALALSGYAGMAFRVGGMVLTFTALGLAALLAVLA